jgi:hypothetical protein
VLAKASDGVLHLRGWKEDGIHASIQGHDARDDGSSRNREQCSGGGALLKSGEGIGAPMSVSCKASARVTREVVGGRLHAGARRGRWWAVGSMRGQGGGAVMFCEWHSLAHDWIRERGGGLVGSVAAQRDRSHWRRHGQRGMGADGQWPRQPLASPLSTWERERRAPHG